MNQPAPTEEHLTRIDSLLVPLTDRELLVPMSLVAEVVKLQNSEITSGTDATDKAWLYGWMQWREQRLPLISFEALSGDARPAKLNENVSVTVFNVISDQVPLDFYALVTRGFPHNIRIDQDDELVVFDKDVQAGQLLRLLVEDSLAVIPDLDWVEQQLADIF